MMLVQRETHPLQDKEVRLNDTVSDPQRSMLWPGAVFRVVDWFVNMDDEAAEPLVVPRNWAEKWYIQRALTNHLPLTDLVYGKVNNLGHLVHVSELGEEVTDG